MSYQNQKKIFLSNSKNLFLVDGVGALVSAFLLGIIFVKFENHFGIPLSALYFLAILPCVFALYDLYCFTNKKAKNTVIFLKIIASLNIGYCFITLGLAFSYYKEITFFGWTYFLLEVLIVTSIAFLEYKTADFIKKGVHANNSVMS